MMPDPLLDVSRARVSHDSDGAVTIDDPDAPLVVRLWITAGGAAHPAVSRVQVDSRGPDITTARLCRLPMAQMRYVAAAEADRARPNEPLYGMLARPRPPQGWGDDHWAAVLTVWERGEDLDGRGGGVRAVARLWGVTVQPTAYRWVAEARRRQGGT